MTKRINWIIQKNLVRSEVLEQMKNAIKKDGEYFEEVKIVPFSLDLPQILHNDMFNIVYGSTTFMLNAYENERWKTGVFFDHERFSMSHYVQVWGSNMLNFEGNLIRLDQIKEIKSKAETNWFLRPNYDGKEFAGFVDRFEKLIEWSERICSLKMSNFNSETLVWISKPHLIQKEWRLFVVDNKIVSAARYMVNGDLAISLNDLPFEMLEFANDRINEFRLHDVYVMDIALCENQYKMIECNCFNGTGFYQHDIEKIVFAINHFIRTRYELD